jgi:hypothetical protein
VQDSEHGRVRPEQYAMKSAPQLSRLKGWMLHRLLIARAFHCAAVLFCGPAQPHWTPGWRVLSHARQPTAPKDASWLHTSVYAGHLMGPVNRAWGGVSEGIGASCAVLAAQ